MLPGFRDVLDCASPLALWLPLQKWVHGPDARPILEVEALHEPEIRFVDFQRLVQLRGSWSHASSKKDGGFPEPENRLLRINDLGI